MFCNKCGSQLPDDALFCDFCGARVNRVKTPKEKTSNDGVAFKCPYCGEYLSSSDLKCPTCGKEIRGKEVTKSVKEFFESIYSIGDVNKLIFAIRTYPIPNGREDIIEFMFLASSCFDVDEYLAKEHGNTVAEAWLSKIEQCHDKAHILFTDSNDLKIIDEQYKAAKSKISGIKTKKALLITFGVICIALGTICFILIFVFLAFFTPLSVVFAFISLLHFAVGIPLLISGLNQIKTDVTPSIGQINKATIQNYSTAPMISNDKNIAPKPVEQPKPAPVVEQKVETNTVEQPNPIKQEEKRVVFTANLRKESNNKRIKPIKAPKSAYYVECPNCNFGIRYDLSDVRSHRKWPNGFIYCPNCKKPVGFNKYDHIEYEIVFETTCPKCHKNVVYDLDDVIQHRRWPNGYVDCPYCKTHLGHNKQNRIIFDEE